MKKLSLLIIVVLLASFSFAVTDTVSTFTNGLSIGNLTYNENITSQYLFFTVPKYSYLSNLSINITTYQTNIVFSSNVSSISYNIGTVPSAYVWVDNDYISSAGANAFTEGNVSLNRTLASFNKINESILYWQIKDVQGTINHTIPVGCYNNTDTLQKVVDIYENDWYYLYCYNNNNNSWQEIYYKSVANQAAIIEEDLWQIDKTILFNISTIEDLNNTYYNLLLENGCSCSNCSISGIDCSMMINFTFNGPTEDGILQYSNFIANYSYGLDDCSNTFNIQSKAKTINFSFKDETNNTAIPADVDASFTYDLSDGNSDTYDVDLTDVYNFSLCIYPNWTQLNLDYQVFYSNEPDYLERRYYEDTVFDDVLTQKTLYLLNSNDGIYARFRTVDNYDNILTSVTVIMKDAETENIIEQESTDSSGIATFWVDPNNDYIFEFTKTGYQTNSVTLRPTTTEIYTITLNQEQTTQNVTKEAGTSYRFYPVDTQLQNKTSYTFTFNLSSYQNFISGCTLSLIDNNSNTISSSSTSFNDTNCNIAITINTGSNLTILSQAEYILNGTTFSQNKKYIVYDNSVSGYSLSVLIDDLSNFSGAGFGASGRFIVAFIIIISTTIYLGKKVIPKDNDETVIILFLIMIGLFSFIGWLTLDFQFIPSIPGFNLKQYLIFILMILLGGAYIIKRHN